VDNIRAQRASSEEMRKKLAVSKRLLLDLEIMTDDANARIFAPPLVSFVNLVREIGERCSGQDRMGRGHSIGSETGMNRTTRLFAIVLAM
jgi:hypothetical protein